jgi:hypothetical protein
MERKEDEREQKKNRLGMLVGAKMALIAFGVVFEQMLGRTTPPTTYDAKRDIDDAHQEGDTIASA